MNYRSFCLPVLSTLCLIAGVVAGPARADALPDARAAPSQASYIDAGDSLRDEAQITAWYEMLHHLRDNFDEICGDTFCEGDYSNIYALRLRCSVEQASGVLGRCVWVFAASNEEVDPATGKIQVTPKVWRCRVPLAPKTTVSALLGALAGERPLYAKLPGTSVSIYEGLSDCL